MTEKQIVYADYLLKCLGFSGYQANKEFVDAVDNYMTRDYRFVISLQESYGLAESNPEDLLLGRQFKLNVIDCLKLEYDIKYRGLIRFRKTRKDYISATDISSYVFCPASFSIKNSIMTIEDPAEEEGTSLHEKMMLIKYLKPGRSYGLNQNLTKNQDAIQKQLIKRYPDFYRDVSESYLVFCGHNTTEDQPSFFTNEEQRYVGQPDYIFKKRNSAEHFVVEEKFHLSAYYNKTNSMYKNQLAQLASYICLIDKFYISYGYIVHWIYSFDTKGIPYVMYAEVTRMNNTENNAQKVINIIDHIQNFVRDRKIEFNPQQNSWTKCARCSLRIWCGHKNRQVSTLSFPYSDTYLKLKYQKFPDELRNKK